MIEYDPGAGAVRTHWEIDAADRAAVEERLGAAR